MLLKPKSYNSNNDSAIDLLMLMLLIFMPMAMNRSIEVKTKKNIISKAEILITVTWDKDDPSDVDTWFQDPKGNIISFQQKQKGLMHLDRDDLGHSNDKVTTEFGVFQYDENKEIVTIRGTMQGEYTLNVHMYAKATHYNNNKPTMVNIKVEKLNPYKVILIRQVSLEFAGDLKFVCNFTVNKDGEVKEMNTTREIFLFDSLRF